MVLKMSASSFITQLPPTPDCSPSPLPLMDCVPLHTCKETSTPTFPSI